MSEKLVQVRAPHFVAGLVSIDGKVTLAAPILKYMQGWDDDKVRAYVFSKSWKAVLVAPKG